MTQSLGLLFGFGVVTVVIRIKFFVTGETSVYADSTTLNSLNVI